VKTAYLVIVHGSREKQANQVFNDLIDVLRKELPDRFIQGAFLELAQPNIPEGIELCVKEEAQSIVIIPMMFFPGRHVKEDIPRFMQEAKSKYPQVDFHYSGTLSENPDLLVSWLKGKAQK